MAETLQGKIALEEHFYLPSYELMAPTARRSTERARLKCTFPTFLLPSRRD
jgi:hypothetical protein